jgi:hypothetical protein
VRATAEALQRAGSDQLCGVGAQGGQDGTDSEDRDADHEHRATPEAVAQRGGDQDHRGERERVRVDEPLEFFHGGTEALMQHRQGVGHHEVVQSRHEHRQRGREHDEPERPAACRGKGGESHDGLLSMLVVIE